MEIDLGYNEIKDEGACAVAQVMLSHYCTRRSFCKQRERKQRNQTHGVARPGSRESLQHTRKVSRKVCYIHMLLPETRRVHDCTEFLQCLFCDVLSIVTAHF